MAPSLVYGTRFVQRYGVELGARSPLAWSHVSPGAYQQYFLSRDLKSVPSVRFKMV